MREMGEHQVTTISDVAARAGVSKATVSRVLNGIAVREDLAESVRQAAAELEFSPSRAARSLRRQLGEVIALILPDIENPYFTSLARGVEDVAQEHGYSVVLCNSDDDTDKESRYLKISVSENMAGVVIAPAADTTSVSRLTGRRQAVVVVDRAVSDDVDHVLEDNDAVGRQAVNALIERGFRRIACVTGPENILTAGERAAAWRDEMLRHGLETPDEMLVYANFRVDGGRAAAAQLLRLPQQPEAILATNNLVGVGVLQVLSERADSHEPIGVGIIGDLPFATSNMAGISLVALHPREMGMTAARLLIDRVNGAGSKHGARVILPSRPL
jgi:LacI family transcriptional regulator